MTIDLKDVYKEQPAAPVAEETKPVAAPVAKMPAPQKFEPEEDLDDEDFKEEEEESEESEEEFAEEVENGEEAEESEDEQPAEDKELEEDEPETPPAKQVDVNKIIGKRTEEIRSQRDKIRDEKTDLEKLIAMGLKDMIHEGEDIKTALKRLAAENKGVKPEDIDKELREAREFEEFKASKAAAETAKVHAMAKQQHLAAIRQVFPDETAASIELIPNFDKFAKLMRTGEYDPVEAYTLARGSDRKAANAYAKQKVMAEGKKHLVPTNARSVAPTLSPIPKADLEFWKAAFPDLPHSELVKKYNAGRK